MLNISLKRWLKVIQWDCAYTNISKMAYVICLATTQLKNTITTHKMKDITVHLITSADISLLTQEN